MTRSDKAQQMFRAIATLRDEYISEGRTMAETLPTFKTLIVWFGCEQLAHEMEVA